MGLKFWGYTAEARSSAVPRAVELAEVTLSATPAQLRKVAQFILAAADGIEEHGSGWEHEHLSDSQPGFKRSPSFVVFNQQHRAQQGAPSDVTKPSKKTLALRRG